MSSKDGAEGDHYSGYAQYIIIRLNVALVLTIDKTSGA